MNAAILLLTGILTIKAIAFQDIDKRSLIEIPIDIAQDIISIAVFGVANIAGDCTEIKQNDLQLFSYTKENKNQSLVINYKNNTLDSIDLNVSVKILIHGWIASTKSSHMQEMKNKLLEKTEAFQAILVDWDKIANSAYTTSFCKLPQLGQVLGKYLCDLSAYQNATLDNVHIIGHSLGGQMASLIGNYVQKYCRQTLGRITALDPAGPGFIGLPQHSRLDKKDAKIVDVWHTNMAGFGYPFAAGTIDYFINCGYTQPGCFPTKNVETLADLVEIPLHLLMCSHGRSYEYFLESIDSKQFVAVGCPTCPQICVEDVLQSQITIMSEKLYTDLQGNFVIHTNSSKTVNNLHDSNELLYV